MTKKKEKKFQRVIPPIIFVLLLLAVAGLSLKFLLAEPAPQLILDVITLKKTESTIKRADIIAKTDDLVVAIGNQNIEAEWSILTECLAEGCGNADYLNFIQIVAYEAQIPNYELIINLVLTYKYWGSEEVVKFSKALTTVDSTIEELNIRILREKWKNIVECDGVCPNKADLYLDLIKEVVKTG